MKENSFLVCKDAAISAFYRFDVRCDISYYKGKLGESRKYMIIRYRKKPLSLQKIDALIARLPEGHPKMAMLRKQAAMEQKGFNGERKLDYHIESLSDDYSVLNDICFSLYGKKTQIDSLIMSAQAIFIIEVKSYEGVITFDPELRQCYRVIEGEAERFKYPITQVEAIQSALLRLLQLAHLSGLPIYYFIAFSERSTLIKVKGEEESVKKVVTYVEDVPFQVMKINDQLMAQKSSQPNNQLRSKVVQYIMQHCEDFDKDILSEFNIKQADILTGVHCPDCHHLGMVRKIGNWYCPNCDAISKTAHLKSLQDYALLFGSTITNVQCSHFLHIQSRHTTKYILQQSTLLKNIAESYGKLNIHPSNRTFRK